MEEQRVEEIVEGPSPVEGVTAGPTLDLSNCPMCTQPAEDFGEHLQACSYMDRGILGIFQESVPEEILRLFDAPDNAPITAGDMKHIVRGILSRQEKVNSVFQFRMAKLANRAVGAGNPDIPEEERTKWRDV